MRTFNIGDVWIIDGYDEPKLILAIHDRGQIYRGSKKGLYILIFDHETSLGTTLWTKSPYKFVKYGSGLKWISHKLLKRKFKTHQIRT